MATVTGTLPPTVLLLLDDFLAWAQRDRKPQTSLNTAKRYRRYAELLCGMLGHPVHITAEDLLRWRTTVEGESANTVNVKIAAVRCFFAYLRAKQIRSDDPTDVLVMMSVPHRQPRPLNRQTIKALFDAVYAQPNLQDRAILEVLYGSGLRRDEAGRMTLRAIQDRHKMQIVGKGDKERMTIITEPEYRAVRDWILSTDLADERTRTLQTEISDDAAFDDLRKRKPDEGVFYGIDGTPVARYEDPGNFIFKRCCVYFDLVGEPDATPHQFRHSFATHLLSNGADLYIVSRMLGHSDLNITKQYLGLEDRSYDAARIAHPRAA